MRKLFVFIIVAMAILSCYKQLGNLSNRFFFILNEGNLELIDGETFDYNVKGGVLTLKIVAPESLRIGFMEEYDWITISAREIYPPQECLEFNLEEHQFLHCISFQIMENKYIKKRKAKLILGNDDGIPGRAEFTIRQAGK